MKINPKQKNLLKKLAREFVESLPERQGSAIARRTSFLDSHHPWIVSDNGVIKKIEVPIYADLKVPAFHCARYVRYAAKDIFDKNYVGADAWNMRYNERIVVSGDELPLTDTQIFENIKPGMVLGLYWSDSKYNEAKDIKENPRKYTHVALAIGSANSIFGKDYSFAHKVGSETRLDTINELREIGFMPEEILNSKS